MANPQARLPLPSQEVMLTVLSGPESGVAYKLMGQNISLGRSSENDVVLQDAKSSRAHATIERRGDQYWIVDLDSKTGVYVNGKIAREAALNIGDSITLGDTLLRFGSPQPLSLVNSAPPMPTAANPLVSRPRRPVNNRANENNTLVAIGVVIVVVIGVFAIQKSSNTQHHKATQIKGDAEFDEQLEATTDANDKTQQEILKKGKDTQQYSEAQAFYLRGFREFREGNYGRGIQNFQAALALYPNHPLAKRYLERSVLKNNELVTAALQRGEKDFQLERYNNAFNEYRTVILLTNDARNKNYQLAQKRIEAIQLILVNSK